MHLCAEAKESLNQVEWKENLILPFVEGPYRYRIVVHCSSLGRQKAEFANGEHPYFCYVEIIDDGGNWIKQGGGIVPVLPDGRLIMIVEQRPAQGCYPNRSMIAEIHGRKVDLHVFGPYSSLEFPGGGVNPGEGLKAGFLRELSEETGVVEQSALFYSRCHPVYAFGSDIAGENFLGVVFLSGFSFSDHVATDGGLNVLALVKEEVEHNVLNGVIHSGQAALLQWGFYKEVEMARSRKDFQQKLIDAGYLSVERIKVSKSKP